jgi:ribosomal protein L14
MLLKQSWVYLADNTTVRWLRLFHLFKGFNRKVTRVGLFVKGSARIVEPPRIEYKGFKVKFNKKGDICRSLIIRVVQVTRRIDGSSVNFKFNSGLLIKKQQTLKSKYNYGPVTCEVRRKKIKLFFQIVL